jgi:hypothetical protein
MLKDFATSPDRAWQALVSSGATHVVLHEAGFEPGRGELLARWLMANGAREVAAFGADRVFTIH